MQILLKFNQNDFDKNKCFFDMLYNLSTVINKPSDTEISKETVEERAHIQREAPELPSDDMPAKRAAIIVETHDTTAPGVIPQAPVPTNTQPVVPTTAPQYTLDMIARAGTALLDAGKMEQVTDLLTNKFGVEALTSLKPEQYGAVAMELRALGANI